jgi:hypothetical protein
MVNMSPKEYRAKYTEILRQADKSPKFQPDPDKYRFKGKDEREDRMYGFINGKD